jgi:hypothetical protein
MSTWGENPLFHLTRLFITFLQELFAQAPSGSFHWSDDDRMTEVIISDETPINMEVIEKRPAIVTVRSGVAWAGIGNDQLMSMKIRTGEEVHTDMISGNMTLNCMSRVAVEAEYLAWLCSRHVWILKHTLMKWGFHKVGEQIQVMGRSPAGQIVAGDTEGEVILVPVIIPFFFQWTERIQEKDLPVLDAVTANINARMASVIQAPVTRNPIRGTTQRPRNETQKKRMLQPPSIRGRMLQPVEPVRPGSQPDPDGVTITVKTR